MDGRMEDSTFPLFPSILNSQFIPFMRWIWQIESFSQSGASLYGLE